MTISTTATRSSGQHARLLTDFDQLDIAEAIRNAAHYNCTSLNVRDRQALALLTYVPELRGITRMLAAKLANGTASLPMPQTLAMHLLDVNSDDDMLGPEPDWDVQEAWLTSRENAASEAAGGAA